MRFTTGFSWFGEALRALQRRPMALSCVCLFNLITGLMLSGLPVLGVLLAALWLPFGTLLATDAARRAVEGADPDYGILSRAWADKPVRYGLLTLGIAYAVAVEVSGLLFSLLARADMQSWVLTDEGLDMQSVLNHLPVSAFIVSGLIYLVILMANAFAPILLARGGQSWKKALFYSFFGSLKNWAPALAFGLALVVLALALTAALTGVGLVVGAGRTALYVAPFVTVFMSVVAQVGLWPAYRDMFSARA